MRRSSEYVLGVLIAVAFIALLTLCAFPAQAHDDHDLREWLTTWHHRVETRGALSSKLVAEYTDMVSRHPCNEILRTPCAPVVSDSPTLSAQSHTGMGSNVEMWRSLVAAYFGPNTDAALRVMRCESGGNAHAYNPSSGASGLFQFLPSTWRRVTGQSYPGGVFDGNDNIAAAFELSDGGTNWSQWSCKP